jgi:hypothetical protein
VDTSFIRQQCAMEYAVWRAVSGVASLHTQVVFGWVVAFAKAVVGCGLWKNSCEKAAVGKAEDRLVERLWLLEKHLSLTHGPHAS